MQQAAPGNRRAGAALRLASALLLAALPLVSTGQTFAPHVRTWALPDGRDLDAAFVKEQAGQVTVRETGGTTRTLMREALGTEDLRYLANIASATNGWRTWKRGNLPPFTGAFLFTQGEDNERSKKYVVMVDAFGRRRAHPFLQLSPEDQTYVKEMVKKQAAARGPVVPYEMQYLDYDPSKDKDVEVFGTDHFSFWWGANPANFQGDGAHWKNPKFREMNYDYFEDIWRYYQDIVKVPMPYTVPIDLREPGYKPGGKYKIPIYVTGTGLPRHREGWAFGSRAIVINPGAMLEGSSVIPHEFTHVMQFFMGGFRDNPLVGFFWECHANWSCHQFIPDLAPVLEHYAERAHYELNSSRHNYGSWPFLQYISEHPRFRYSFPYDIWRQNRKENGHSVEDPFQTIMRYGAELGAFRGDGVQGFGDVIGEMASHNAFWDYTYEEVYRRTLSGVENRREVARNRTMLQPVADRAGWLKPIYSHTPRQYGYNLIDLKPEPGTKAIEVDLEGVMEEGEGSDWRARLVALDAQGLCRYSRLWNRGRGRIDVRPGDRAFVLSVAATPSVYKPLDFRIGYNNKRRYPYEVRITGAVPASEPPHGDIGTPRDAQPHPNGGGLVARSAKVAPTAYVGPHARVLGGAKVSERARIEDFAVVSDRCEVSGNAVVGGWSRLFNHVQVKDQARVTGWAVVDGDIEIAERARVTEYVQVRGRSRIAGDALLRGWGDVDLAAQSPVAGGAIFGEDLEVHFDNRNAPLTGGMIYGYENPEFLSRTPDNKYLFALWDGRRNTGGVLRDWNADCDGILRGAPKFGEEAGRTYLELDGRTQYALVEGHVADAVAMTVDADVFRGAGGGEYLMDFGSREGRFSILLSGERRTPEVRLQSGQKMERIVANKPIALRQWTRLTVTLDGKVGRIYLDGQLAGENAQMTLSPTDARAYCGFVGRPLAAGAPMAGRIGRIAVYRTAWPDLASIPDASGKKDTSIRPRGGPAGQGTRNRGPNRPRS